MPKRFIHIVDEISALRFQSKADRNQCCLGEVVVVVENVAFASLEVGALLIVLSPAIQLGLILSP